MKVLFIVHGNVQGVGYRWLVKKAAFRNSIRGSVRNMEDGSVRIIAIAEKEPMDKFEKEINVDMKNGPSVMHIEKYEEHSGNFPKCPDYEKFVIER